MRVWGMAIGLVGLVTVSTLGADDRKFFRDDPVWVDHDRIDTPVQPAVIELSDLYDRLRHTFGDMDAPDGEARNINTLDELPDSAWFTNRHGRQRMSRAELMRGPNRDTGPDPSGVWTIIGGKRGGLTPGFEMMDAGGVRYVIKLDPVGLPELSSSAEVIATKLFHAIGYNVPENHIVEVHPDVFQIDPEAEITDEFGERRRLTPGRLRQLLASVPRGLDGRVRVTASRYLEGVPIGPFLYQGTRSDDPNDIIPHEDRRELRGLRLFAAWMNHDDVRAQNTLDTWIADGDTHYVRHHLIDFGSTFGSGTVDLQLPNLGFHYWLDMDLVKRNALGFGFHTPRYRTVAWPNFPKYASVGRFESDAFDPHDWKPDYPNPAFARMTDRDAGWAASIIAAFTADDLHAIVSTGQLSDPDQERYFYDTLVARQQKVLQAYGDISGSLKRFQVDGDHLTFVNPADTVSRATTDTDYRARWAVYNNSVGTMGFWSDVIRSTRAELVVPRHPLGPNELLVAKIWTSDDDDPAETVAVYLRATDGDLSVVGVERAGR